MRPLFLLLIAVSVPPSVTGEIARADEEAITFKVEHTGTLKRGPTSSPDRRLEAKVVDDLKLQLIDAKTGKDVGAPLEHGKVRKKAKIRSFAFSPDGKLVASGASDGPTDDDEGEVRVWEVATGKLVASARADKHDIGHIRAISWADNKTVRVDASMLSGR